MGLRRPCAGQSMPCALRCKRTPSFARITLCFLVMSVDEFPSTRQRYCSRVAGKSPSFAPDISARRIREGLQGEFSTAKGYFLMLPAKVLLPVAGFEANTISICGTVYRKVTGNPAPLSTKRPLRGTKRVGGILYVSSLRPKDIF